MDTSYYYTRSFVVMGVWLVVGIIMGNKAKQEGLSFGLYFVLTWFLGIIGLIITNSAIKKQQEKNRAIQYQMQMQSMYMNQNVDPYGTQQYGAPQYGAPPPYDPNAAMYQQPGQPIQQNNPYGTNMGAAPGYGAPQQTQATHTCMYCGNTQSNGGFCEMCGAKID